MGKDALRADIARIIELARQAEAAGTPVNKSAIAHAVKRDRGFVIRTLQQWEAAGKPDTWPLAATSAITIEAVANTQASPLTPAIFTTISRQSCTVKELAFQLQAKASEVMAALETMPDAKEDEAGRWRVDAPKPPDPITDDRARIQQQRELSELKGKYKDALSQLTEAEAQRDALLAVQEAVEPARIEADHSINGGQATAVMLASDWHVGERVDPSTINYLNEYTPEIAEERARRFFQNGLKLVRKERQDVQIDTLILWLGGDLITGYIHQELEESNYLSPIEESLHAKRLILGGLKMLKEDGGFKRIIVPTSFGNHGRTTQKRRISTGYKNSYEWLLYKELEATFKGDDVIDMRVVNGYLNFVDCYDYTLAFHHGDDTFYKGGIGGMTIPLLKYIARIDQQRRCYMHNIGHYHTRIPYSSWYRFQGNGSLIGYNAYAQSIGASPERPVQNFQLIDAERGATIAAPILVDEDLKQLARPSMTGWRQAA